jgi:sugar (glycoside-pentoside-hexuronide) transporter
MGPAPAPREASAPALGVRQKAIYGLGDLSTNAALATLALVYASYFLTQVAGLRPALAGLVPLVGRTIDAITDPIMGRLSDRTRWRSGRRRPYLLIGALPFGASFALLWTDPSTFGFGDGQTARFLYYATVYSMLCVWMTVLSIPYLALLPEMAPGYDERTSLNVWRNVGSIFGIGVAIAIRPLAEALGGGPSGYASAGTLVGVAIALPWFAVHRATFERPGPDVEEPKPLLAALGELWQNLAFRRLMTLYLAGRIAMDLLGTLLILYLTFWLVRPGGFEPVMLGFLVAVCIALPGWLRLSLGREKATMFIVGALWWTLSGAAFTLAEPSWPLWSIVALAAVTAVGYAAVDLMPWAMLGEVIDADELASGERRDGLYNGVFTFLRKLAGALGVFLVLGLLDLLGFHQGEEQTETVRHAIRWLTFLAPTVCLALAAIAATGYPLTRAAHAEIVARLVAGAAGGDRRRPPRGGG